MVFLRIVGIVTLGAVLAYASQAPGPNPSDLSAGTQTPVMDQGAASTCWAFATATSTSLSMSLYTESANVITISPQSVISCGKGFHETVQGGSHGNWQNEAIGKLSNGGWPILGLQWLYEKRLAPSASGGYLSLPECSPSTTCDRIADYNCNGCNEGCAKYVSGWVSDESHMCSPGVSAEVAGSGSGVCPDPTCPDEEPYWRGPSGWDCTTGWWVNSITPPGQLSFSFIEGCCSGSSFLNEVNTRGQNMRTALGKYGALTATIHTNDDSVFKGRYYPTFDKFIGGQMFTLAWWSDIVSAGGSTWPDHAVTIVGYGTVQCDETLQGDQDAGYRGCQTKTRSGQYCQPWTHQKPHTQDRTPENYPDAGLVDNYCRNPDGSDTIWCYTTNPNVRWELCDPLPESNPINYWWVKNSYSPGWGEQGYFRIEAGAFHVEGHVAHPSIVNFNQAYNRRTDAQVDTVDWRAALDQTEIAPPGSWQELPITHNHVNIATEYLSSSHGHTIVQVIRAQRARVNGYKIQVNYLATDGARRSAQEYTKTVYQHSDGSVREMNRAPSGSQGLSTGAIVGIAVGGAAVVALVAALAVYKVQKSKQSEQPDCALDSDSDNEIAITQNALRTSNDDQPAQVELQPESGAIVL